MNQTTISYILAGGNLGDVEGILNEAAKKVDSISQITIKRRSGLYKSAAWGFEHSNFFLNQAWEVETSLSANALLSALLEVEHQMGRTRSANYEARTIDLDIIFFGSDVIHQEGLTIPHSLMHKRKFVLVPLNELIPAYIHPELKKPVKVLLEECTDNVPVTLWIQTTAI